MGCFGPRRSIGARPVLWLAVMTSVNSLAMLATAIGEPARAAMLVALLDGRAYTAGELAAAAGVAPPTGSAHLTQLAEAGLLTVARLGRHRYHRLASPAVAAMLEGMLAIAGAPAVRPIATGPRDHGLRRARRCYDHLAGALAVGIADALARAGELVIEADSALMSDAGMARLAQLDVAVPGQGRALCRPCLDWSERRPHLGGAIGAGLLDALLARQWLRPGEGRALTVTPTGAAGLERVFGVR